MSGMPQPIEPGLYDGLKVFSFDSQHFLNIDLKLLDIFCVAGDSILSKGIRFVTKNQNPDRESEFNHTGILSGGSCTLECLWTLTSKNLFYHYQGKRILIGRWNKINDNLRLKAMLATNKHIGQIYPAYRIPLHLINIAHIFHWKKLVCSEYVAKVLFKAGARHHNFYGTNPDHLADEIRWALNEERTGPKYTILYDDHLPVFYYRYCPLCNGVHPTPYFKNKLMSVHECPIHKQPLMEITPSFQHKYPIIKKIIDYEIDLTNYITK
jgi:hypothetical protein